MRAIDTYWICTAEHGLNASTFTARIVASTGADCAAALSSAVGALSGPLHGGAPARVLPMLDAAAEAGDVERYVNDLLDRGDRLMGFGHRVYRAEDPRARLLRGTAKELGSPRYDVAEELEQAALAALRREVARPRRSRRTSSSGRRSCSTSPTSRRALAPAMFACSRTAGWSAHILEQKRLGRLVRPSGALRRARPALGLVDRMTLAEAAAHADELAAAGDQNAGSRRCAANGTTRSRRRARSTDYRVRALRPTARSRSSASGRSSSCCAAGSRTRARPRAARR